MKTIRKKVNQKFFAEILSGKKKFELRLNDFDIKEGDNIVLEEHDEQRNLTGKIIEKKVTYVAKIDLNNGTGKKRKY